MKRLVIAAACWQLVQTLPTAFHRLDALQPTLPAAAAQGPAVAAPPGAVAPHSLATASSVGSGRLALKELLTSSDVFADPTLPVQQVASCGTIVWVFAALLGPIIAAWLLLHRSGHLGVCYAAMLAISMVAVTACFDMANQSASAVMDAPNAITATHASALAMLMGLWSALRELRQLQASPASAVMQWTVVAICFTVYQLVNHMVSYMCTLSERVVFMNLCPVASFLIETLVMPAEHKPNLTVIGKVSLVTMTFGAFLFAYERHNITASGLLYASLLVLTVIPYRVSQRYLLSGSCKSLPVGFLCAMDGAALLLPSASLSGLSLEHSVASFRHWFSTGSVVGLLLLSSVAFVANHCMALLILKAGSATSYLVYYNIANFFVIGGSFFLFHEVMESSLMAAGLALSLLSGLTYAVEASCSPWSPREDGKEDMKGERSPEKR
mmetsp:Transcript_70420/g.197502  ORF Transcript_70420/g.197502 Transcript_70420/m.197502 type:complete len:440 (+) Transcript_70420:75-1394(+)